MMFWLSYDVFVLISHVVDILYALAMLLNNELKGLKAVLDSKEVIKSLLIKNLVFWKAYLNQSCYKFYELALV